VGLRLSLGGKTSRGLGLVRVEWHRVVETALERDNPFASLLSSRDLLAAPEAPGEPREEAAAVGPPLPATGDPEAWRQLVDLVAEMPEVDKGLLGQRAAELGLTKETINDRLGLGLEGRQARRSWDRALDVLVEHGFLVDHQGRLVPAGREPRGEPAAEEPAAPARDPELQRLYDTYVGAMARSCRSSPAGRRWRRRRASRRPRRAPLRNLTR
jgi:hypothetical protein